MNLLRTILKYFEVYFGNLLFLMFQIFISLFLILNFSNYFFSMRETNKELTNIVSMNPTFFKISNDEFLLKQLSAQMSDPFYHEYIKLGSNSYSFLDMNNLSTDLIEQRTIVLVGNINLLDNNLQKLNSKTIYLGDKATSFEMGDKINILGHTYTLNQYLPKGSSIINFNWGSKLDLDHFVVLYLSYEDFFEDLSDPIILERLIFNTTFLKSDFNHLNQYISFIKRSSSADLYPVFLQNNNTFQTAINQYQFLMSFIILAFLFIMMNIMLFFNHLFKGFRRRIIIHMMYGATKKMFYISIVILSTVIYLIPFLMVLSIFSMNPDFKLNGLFYLFLGIIALVTSLPTIIKIWKCDLYTLFKEAS